MSHLPRKTGSVTLMRRIGAGAVTERFAAILDEPAGVKVTARLVNPVVTQDEHLNHQLHARLTDLQRLDHPQFAKTLPSPNATDFLVLEADPGGLTLDTVLQGCRQRHARFPVHLFLHIAVELCNALATLHAQPNTAWPSAALLHGRLTPSAVHLVPGGRVVLGDFGLLRSPLDIPAGTTQAPPANARFLSPEQTQPGAALSPASDIFSLGSVLYECLTLEPLFGGDSDLDAIFQLRHSDVRLALARAAQLLTGVDRVLARALTQDPAHRYQQAFVIREDLRGLMAQYSFADIHGALDAWLVPFHAPTQSLSTFLPTDLDRPAEPSDTGSLLASSVQPVSSAHPTLQPPDEPPPEAAPVPLAPPSAPTPGVHREPSLANTSLPDFDRESSDEEEAEDSSLLPAILTTAGVALVVAALVCGAGGIGLWMYVAQAPADPTTTAVEGRAEGRAEAPAEESAEEGAEEPVVDNAEGRAEGRAEAPVTRPVRSPPERSPATSHAATTRSNAVTAPRSASAPPPPTPSTATMNTAPAAYHDRMEPPPPELLDDASLVDTAPMGDELDAAVARAELGQLTSDDRAMLEAIPELHQDYLRATLALYQDARARDDQRGRARYIAQLMAMPENQYNPMLLIEEAELLVRRKRYAQALDRANQAERYWARLPSEHIFTRKAMIYEIQAGAHQGLFYDSGGEDMAELDAALRGWERYRDHANTKARTDLSVKADAQITRLLDMKRRVGG